MAQAPFARGFAHRGRALDAYSPHPKPNYRRIDNRQSIRLHPRLRELPIKATCASRRVVRRTNDFCTPNRHTGTPQYERSNLAHEKGGNAPSSCLRPARDCSHAKSVDSKSWTIVIEQPLAEGGLRSRFHETRAREQRSTTRTNRYRLSPFSFALGALGYPMSPNRNHAPRRHGAHTSAKPKTTSHRHTAKCNDARTAQVPSVIRDTSKYARRAKPVRSAAS